MKLYFRLDANELIGGGHLFRCMSYANYFKKKFTKITFIIRSTPKHLKNVILKNSFEYIEMNIDPKQFSKKNEKIEISTLEKILNKKDILIIDHYYLTEGYKKYINYKLCKIFVLSDRLIKQSNYSIINYSPFSDQFNNTKSNFFYGLNYAPFRNNYIHKFKFQRNINNYNVLINLGISYKSDINKILKVISKINISSSFTIFIPTTNKLDNIQKLKLNNLKIIVFKNLGDLMPLYKKIHFAIGAFGYSSLERLYCGIPQILIQTAINQKYNVKFFKVEKKHIVCSRFIFWNIR